MMQHSKCMVKATLAKYHKFWLLGIAPQGGLLSAHFLRYDSHEGP